MHIDQTVITRWRDISMSDIQETAQAEKWHGVQDPKKKGFNLVWKRKITDPSRNLFRGTSIFEVFSLPTVISKESCSKCIKMPGVYLCKVVRPCFTFLTVEGEVNLHKAGKKWEVEPWLDTNHMGMGVLKGVLTQPSTLPIPLHDPSTFRSWAITRHKQWVCIRGLLRREETII